MFSFKRIQQSPELLTPNNKPRGRAIIDRNHPEGKNLYNFFIVENSGLVKDYAQNIQTTLKGARLIDGEEKSFLTTDYSTDGLEYSPEHQWLGSTYTLLVRIKIHSITGAPHVFAGVDWSNGGQMLRFNSSSAMHHGANGDWENFPFTSTLNVWQTHIFRREGTYGEYWIDGVQQSTANGFLTSSSLGLRYLSGDSTDRFDGDISYLISWRDRYLNNSSMQRMRLNPFDVLKSVP